MVVRHHVEGYEPFVEFMKDFKNESESIYIIFSGSKLENGESWCDDCVNAKPAIEEAINQFADPKAHIIHCEVGDRPFWKDMNCPFRKNTNTRLMVLPTVLKWKNPQRLEGDQCEKIELLELLFTDE